MTSICCARGICLVRGSYVSSVSEDSHKVNENLIDPGRLSVIPGIKFRRLKLANIAGFETGDLSQLCVL